MKVLLIGVGGVGEAIAAIAKPRAWMEQMVLADYNVNALRKFKRNLVKRNVFLWSS
jgi:saccharopine dehydrogenase (NAD+, L-lysine-forming)